MVDVMALKESLTFPTKLLMSPTTPPSVPAGGAKADAASEGRKP